MVLAASGCTCGVVPVISSRCVFSREEPAWKNVSIVALCQHELFHFKLATVKWHCRVSLWIGYWKVSCEGTELLDGNFFNSEFSSVAEKLIHLLICGSQTPQSLRFFLSGNRKKVRSKDSMEEQQNITWIKMSLFQFWNLKLSAAQVHYFVYYDTECCLSGSHTSPLRYYWCSICTIKRCAGLPLPSLAPLMYKQHPLVFWTQFVINQSSLSNPFSSSSSFGMTFFVCQTKRALRKTTGLWKHGRQK